MLQCLKEQDIPPYSPWCYPLNHAPPPPILRILTLFSYPAHTLDVPQRSGSFLVILLGRLAADLTCLWFFLSLAVALRVGLYCYHCKFFQAHYFTKPSVLSRLLYLILTTTLWDRHNYLPPFYTRGKLRHREIKKHAQGHAEFKSQVLAAWCWSTPLVSVTLAYCFPSKVLPPLLTCRVSLTLMLPHLRMYLAGWQSPCSLYSSKATLPVLKVDSWMNPHFHFPLPFQGGMTYSEQGWGKLAIAFPGLSLHCAFWKLAQS